MRLNLDSLRSDIQDHLETRGMVVFHSYPRTGETTTAVHWETETYPDFRQFLSAAESAGVRLVCLYVRQFTEDMIDDALARLEDDSHLPREEHRAIEMRLREMRGYTGFTCQIELSFDLASRVYMYDLHTEWFDDFNEMLDRIDETYAHEHHDPDEPLGGGYFSKN